jgi:hypothetical protein
MLKESSRLCGEQQVCCYQASLRRTGPELRNGPVGGIGSGRSQRSFAFDNPYRFGERREVHDVPEFLS